MTDKSKEREANSGTSRRQQSTDRIYIQNKIAARKQLLIVKKHHATRSHYDFRLGHNRVLLSWVVPAGPSYWPGDQREAIQVADHSRENAFFEGVFPEGYGAGPTLIWDWGTWELLPGCTDVDSCLRSGVLRFRLDGEKLKGIWALIRANHYSGNRRNPNWVLVKERDEFARSETAKSILEEAPNSICTGKSLGEIVEESKTRKSNNKFQRMLFGE